MPKKRTVMWGLLLLALLLIGCEEDQGWEGYANSWENPFDPLEWERSTSVIEWSRLDVVDGEVFVSLRGYGGDTDTTRALIDSSRYIAVICSQDFVHDVVVAPSKTRLEQLVSELLLKHYAENSKKEIVAFAAPIQATFQLDNPGLTPNVIEQAQGWKEE